MEPHYHIENLLNELLEQKERGLQYAQGHANDQARKVEAAQAEYDKRLREIGQYEHDIAQLKADLECAGSLTKLLGGRNSNDH